MNLQRTMPFVEFCFTIALVLAPFSPLCGSLALIVMIIVNIYVEPYRLVGLVVKASASRAEDPGFESRFARGFFSGSSHTSDLKNDTPVATLPGVIGSALGLVGLVSVYCNWVR